MLRSRDAAIQASPFVSLFVSGFDKITSAFAAGIAVPMIVAVGQPVLLDFRCLQRNASGAYFADSLILLATAMRGHGRTLRMAKAFELSRSFGTGGQAQGNRSLP